LTVPAGFMPPGWGGVFCGVSLSAMPDKRRHRGAAPGDRQIFAGEFIDRMRSAVGDLSWLLSRGYAQKSAVKLVGDRFQLTVRQRQAVMRGACSDASLAIRKLRCVKRNELRGRVLYLDGYNVLTSVEAALAGGALFVGRDGCLRDVASMHGSFRKVEETEPAIRLMVETLESLGVARTIWYLDQPVSNSGRLKMMILRIAENNGLGAEVELVPSPDRVLIDLGANEGIVCTADSVILDGCSSWFNLAAQVITRHVESAWVIDLRGGSALSPMS